MTETTNDGSDGPTDQELRDLLDAERHRSLIAERRRRQSQRDQAEEAVSFADVLRALAAHQTPVSVRTVDRALLPSRICEVGRDYVALRCAGAVTRLVPLSRIASATPVPASGSHPTSASDAAGADGWHHSVPLDLAERLRELVGVRARMRMTAGGSAVTGRLRRVGIDVAVLEHEDGTDQFLALAALGDVVVEL